MFEIIGKKDIMDAAQDSFISSTFWTERIGFVAAIATLKKMEENNVQKKLVKLREENKIKHRQFAKTNRKDVLLGG